MGKVILLFVLVALCQAVDWQARGNFTDENMTFIRQTLDKVVPGVPLGTFPMSLLSKNISDTLNSEWDPSWNVIVCYYFEMVFNGYAFR